MPGRLEQKDPAYYSGTQIKQLEEGLPFPIQAFDCDNGGEFLNHALWGYFH